LFFRAIIAFVIIGYMQYSFFLIYNEGLTKQNTSSLSDLKRQGMKIKEAIKSIYNNKI